MNKFVFALHRGGSSVVARITHKCAIKSGDNSIRMGAKAFPVNGEGGAASRTNFKVDNEYSPDGKTRLSRFTPNLESWQKRSGAFASIRRAGYFPVEYFKPDDVALLNMRDPRDCIVSFYYKLRLHKRGLEDEARKEDYDLGIDQFVLQKALPSFLNEVNEYIDLKKKIPGLLVLTYEEMVTDFPSWFDKYYDHMQFDPKHKERLKTVFSPKLTPPEKEDIDSHKRQMKPGDHLRKLRPETLDAVNKALEESLEFFNYPIEKG